MATLTPAVPGTTAPLPVPMGRPRRPRVWRGVVLLIAGVYFLVPLLASFVFTVNVPGQGFTLDAYGQIFTAEGFVRSLLLSPVLGMIAAGLSATASSS